MSSGKVIVRNGQAWSSTEVVLLEVPYLCFLAFLVCVDPLFLSMKRARIKGASALNINQRTVTALGALGASGSVPVSLMAHLDQ